MKSNKIFRILAIGTILALLVVALPVSPVLAAEDITLDPDEGEIGERFYVEGEDFDPTIERTPPLQDTVSLVDIYFTSYKADEGDDIDDEVENYELLKADVYVGTDGEFRSRVTVPEELTDGDVDEVVRGGTYYVCVTDANNKDIVAVAAFTVSAAEMVLDTDDGTVGTEVEITGVDFAGNEDIYVYYDDEGINIESGDDETDSGGGLELTILIPESAAGKHTIKITAGDSEAEADFTVEPEIKVNPTKGAPGDSVTVKGTGFGKRVDVDIEFDGSNVTTDEADTYGSFEIVITVPVKSSGIYKIEAEDEDRNKADVNFTLAAAATLGQTTGNVGSQVTINGTGFTPNGNITVTYAAKTVATTTADANGKFSATFNIPQSTYGEHTVTATDGTNTVSDTFTMEATPPPAPQLVLPLDATKAKSEATFEWGVVNDESKPVTYSLRITTTAGSLVLEKTGLTETTYTLTKEEKLESTKKEAPYYWRVQAVDGADNESGWTSPSSFYVGFTFALTGWILYVLIGLAGLILLLVGILVGRRLAYF